MARGGRSRGPPGQPARAEENEDDSRGERIRVVVRVRPENSHEEVGNFRTVVRVVGEEMLVFDPKEQGSPDYYHGKARRQRDINKRSARDISFVFDRVFGSDSSTMDLFENTTKKILDGLMDGYNCSVFAYGATGAGKTHTMLGTPERPGVIFLTMMDLYRRMEEVKDTSTCDIAVSYLEVYNEQIRDLLMPGGYLPVREDPQRGVIITGLSLHKPHSADELMHMLRIGNSNRTQHPTDANAESSRSHAVFQVFVRQRDRTANTSADWRVAKMSLIDLAGSERATVTKNRGARFREGANINRSLLALGNCINALAEGKSKGYVPYRNSKLTRLLKDSLGGNCRTVMIAAISPSSMSFEDTYNTLRYADRAKNIKVGLKRNVVSVDLHVSRYVQVIEDLRKEVNELKLKLRNAESGILSEGTHSPDLSSKATYQRITTSLDSVFKARVEVRKEMLELESSERDLQYKAYRKQLTLTRIGIIMPGEVETTKCLRRAIDNAQRRRKNIETRRQSLQSRMGDNDSWLHQVAGEIEKSRPNNTLADLLDENLRTRHLDIELRDMRRQAKYLKKLCRAQEREARSMEKFNTVLLQTVYSQYMLIKGHNIASTKELEQFETVQQMACQTMGRTVAWADQSFGAEENAVNVPVTPGPQPGEFSVGALLEFPILSSVPFTPSRTPHHGKRTSTNIPETPASGKRRRRTPRRTPQSARKQRAQSASTPKVSPSQETGTPVNTNDYMYKVQPESSPSCPCRTDGQLTRLSPQGFKTSAANQNDPQCPVQNLFGGQNHDRHLGNIQGSVSESSSAVEGVFPLQLTPEGNPPISRVGQFEQFGTTASLPQPNLGTDSEPAQIQPLPTAQPNGDGQRNETKSQPPAQAFMDNTIVLGPALTMPYEQSCPKPVLDSTVILNSTVGLPLPNVSSPPQRNDFEMSPKTPAITNVAETRSVNSATVTKHGPLSQQGATITKTKPVASGNTVTKQVHNSATVTKSRENDENAFITPPNGPGSVVRAMNFGGITCPSPAGGAMSFAEVLKSPAPARLLQLQDGQPPRSPLARRDNFMNNDIPGPPSRRMTFAPGAGIPSLANGKMFHSSKDAKRLMKQPLPDNPSSRRVTVLHTRRVAEATETLRRFGMPSVLKTAPGSNSIAHGNTPGYMKPTKAASRRNKNHRRSITTNEENKPSGLARRIFVQNENAPPPARRNLAQSRSKSVTHLSMKSGTLNKKPTSAYLS